MSLAQGNNTPTRPRIEPGSPDPESDALTTRPVRPVRSMAKNLNYCEDIDCIAKTNIYNNVSTELRIKSLFFNLHDVMKTVGLHV